MGTGCLRCVVMSPIQQVDICKLPAWRMTRWVGWHLRGGRLGTAFGGKGGGGAKGLRLSGLGPVCADYMRFLESYDCKLLGAGHGRVQRREINVSADNNRTTPEEPTTGAKG